MDADSNFKRGAFCGMVFGAVLMMLVFALTSF